MSKKTNRFPVDELVDEFRVTSADGQVLEMFNDSSLNHALDYFYDKYFNDRSFDCFILWRKSFIDNSCEVLTLWCFVAKIC